jgi:alpha-1,6-mannosyltransferase
MQIKQILKSGNLRIAAREQAEKYSWANTVNAMLEIHNAAKLVVVSKGKSKAA